MFLDPEPRKSRQSKSESNLKQYIPPAAPADQRIIRRPLQEKSSNGTIRQRLPKDEEETPLKPTVRLVRQSPSVADIKKEVFGDTKAGQSRKVQRALRVERAKLGKESIETGFDVSDVPSPTNETSDADALLDNSWQESDVDANDLPAWKRHSFSSSNLSDATTLKGNSIAGFSYQHSTRSRSTRISSGTTLRDAYDSSVLHETDLDDLPESASEAGPSEQLSPSLTSFSEQSPSVTTFSVPSTPARESIRTVESSDHASDHTATPRPPSSHRESWSPPVETGLIISSSPPREFVPSIPPRLSSKHASSASFSSGSVRRKSFDILAQSPLQEDSIISSLPAISPISSPIHELSPEHSEFPASSPNFLAYSSSPVRPRSRSHPLRGEVSYESITQRLQDNAAQRGLTTKESWASLYQTSSQDTLPSIHVPRRRLRQVPGSRSLDATRRSQLTDDDKAIEVTRPAQVSGMTAADESTLIASTDWQSRPHQLMQARSFESYVSEDEPGDMTLNIYREQSAKPAPLFRPRAVTAGSQTLDRRYQAPLPPLPQDAAHAEEHLDMLPELAKPNLRLKRSGYSLRHQRSNSTPAHSRQVSIVSNNESERWSTGSSIFPAWAKHFYSGNVALASMSMISLPPMSTPPTRDGARNTIFDRRLSMRDQRRIASSQPATSVITKSPSSSHILPSIFRPRNRPFRKSIGAMRDLIRPSEQKALPPMPTEVERDSMAIEPIPATPSEHSKLPSGQPRYGELRDSIDAPPRPLPRAYSKQKHWNEMTFPRPMSKDHISEMSPMPHLARTKRSSAQLDAWRPPSFVESIDLIFKSRGHRQILFFLIGFLCPLSWMLGAVMPLPERPVGAFDTEKITPQWLEENTDMQMTQHEAGEAAARWQEEKAWRQGRWWRNVNRGMSIVGLLVIGAVIAIAIVATR